MPSTFFASARRRGSTASTTQKPSSRYVDVLTRVSRLQIVKECAPWRCKAETWKVAIYKDRLAAAIRLIVHIVPLTFALTLIVFNVQGHSTPSYSGKWNTALQFGAKALEVLVQASLGDAFLSFVRRWVLGNTAIPIGAMLAPFQVASLSYLWSLEFWASLTSPWLRRRRRLILCITTVTIMAVAALVGPSGAVLMIPRPIEVFQYRELMLFDPPALLYPTTIEKWPQLEEDARPFNDSLSLATGTISRYAATEPGGFVIEDDFGSRSMLLGGEWAKATLPPAHALQTTNLEYPDLDDVVRSSVLQPAVRLRVHSTILDRSAIAETDLIPFDASSSTIPPPQIHLRTVLQASANATRYANDPNFNLPWSSMFTQEGSEDTPAYVIVLLTNEGLEVDGLSIAAYSIDTAWINATLNFTGTGPAVIENMDSDLLDSMDYWSDVRSTVRLTSSFMHTLLNTTGVMGYEWAIMCLVPVVTVAISNLGAHTVSRRAQTPVTEPVYQRLSGYIDDQGLMKMYKSWGASLASDTPSDIDPYNLTFTSYSTYEATIGYDLSELTVKLSLAVMLIYCAIAITHIIWTLVTGEASGSWDTIGELTMLALNSRRPGNITSTSAGVNTMSTFREPVNVRANEENSLEIIFGNDKLTETTRLRTIVPNERYN